MAGSLRLIISCFACCWSSIFIGCISRFSKSSREATRGNGALAYPARARFDQRPTGGGGRCSAESGVSGRDWRIGGGGGCHDDSQSVVAPDRQHLYSGNGRIEYEGEE